MSETYVEKKTYELTCISPIHIGSGDVLKPIDYAYDKDKQIIYFLDERKWQHYLMSRGLLDDFAAYVSKKRPTLQDWMRLHRISYHTIREMSCTICRVLTNNPVQVKHSINDIHRCLTNPKGIPYIPGSSLKGALRTGLLAWWLKRHPEVHAKYWDEIRENCHFYSRYWSSSLERDVFSCLQLKKARPRDFIVKSCLRGLAVSDTFIDTALHETVLFQKVDASTRVAKDGQREQCIPLFRECLPAGTKLRFTITMDKQMMAELGIHSIAEVIKASRNFTATVLNMEKDVFGKFYKAEFAEAALADMILGGGAGFLSKTVWYALAPDVETGRQVLAKKFDEVSAFQKHKHPTLDTTISPRTLKLTRAASDRWIMGLCSLKEV